MANITFDVTSDPLNFTFEILETGFKFSIPRQQARAMMKEPDPVATLRYALYRAKEDGIIDPDNINLVALRDYIEAGTWPLL